MFKWCFWKDALERAISASATSFASLMTMNVPFQSLNWQEIASIAAVTGVYQIVTAIGALGFGKEDSASFLAGSKVEAPYGRHSQSN